MSHHHNRLQMGGGLPLLVSLSFSNQVLQRVKLTLSDCFWLEYEGFCPQERAVTEWFGAYLDGHSIPFPIPLSLDRLPPFTRQVLERLQKIPFGQTESYSDVAAGVGNRNSSRAVGNACRVNPFPLIIPCHRVLQKDGSLGGFAFGPEMKRAMLGFELEALRVF